MDRKKLLLLGLGIAVAACGEGCAAPRDRDGRAWTSPSRAVAAAP